MKFVRWKNTKKEFIKDASISVLREYKHKIVDEACEKRYILFRDFYFKAQI